MANGRARAAHGPARGSPSPKWAGRAGLKLAKVLPSPNPFMKWAAHGLPVGTRKARNPLGTHGLPMGRFSQLPTVFDSGLILAIETGHGHGLDSGAVAVECSGAWPDGRPWAAQPSPLAAAGSSGRALPEKLARMVASEFILDATIRFKLGRRATNLNWMAASDVNSDATIRASIAGSGAVFKFFLQKAAQTRPKPNRVWAARWAPCPFAILIGKQFMTYPPGSV
ncbi:hypothetical protein PCASD_15787 [Puccinia coronata f. sp. avenae]|uniref:Uncharacterized protein n=1 Tax=Puccinia coronata f. sp. avenae TaxID=200324 RepID=A0A2N5TTQ5_9BASI|nr:hypothetical protein PCASD_15787 [Puccinia coronata f. sp. avenae]